MRPPADTLRPSRAACAALLALALGACSSSAEPASSSFPSDALLTFTSDAGKLVVEVRTSPDQPPAHGAIKAEYRVRDASARAVDGLAIDVVPFMPSMGHGATVTPTVTAQGDGKYLVDSLDLPMAGRWELRTTFSGPVEDRATPAIDVR